MEKNYSLNILNIGDNSKPNQNLFTAEEILVLPQRLILEILRIVSNHLSEIDGNVDYIALSLSEDFKSFCEHSNELVRCDLNLLNEVQRKVFFMNTYNVLTVHALADYHQGLNLENSVKSTLNISNFWRRFGYKIGENCFNLDDIEHGILRSNKMHPTTYDEMFGSNDPRSAYSLSVLDSRIHFALNCGAKSCPAVKVYKAENLDEKLNEVTRAYLQQEIRVEESSEGKVLFLPQILQWYSDDFGRNEKEVLRWIVNFIDGDQKDFVSSLIDTDEKLPLKYYYDWSLN